MSTDDTTRANDDPNDAPAIDEEHLIEDAAGAVAGSTLDDPDHIADTLDTAQ